MMNKEDGKLAQLTETYEKLKKLGMGEEVLAPLRKEIQGLGGDADEPHQVDIRGGVHTDGGDFVARDKIDVLKATYTASLNGDGGIAQGAGSTAIGKGGIGAEGDVTDSILNTGTLNLFFSQYQTPSGKARLSKAEFERILQDYLNWVVKAYGKARLYGLESMRTTRGQPRRQLADVFIPLSLRRFSPPRRDEIEELEGELKGHPLARQRAYLRAVENHRSEGEEIKLDTILTANDRLAVIGGAGCGKSTLSAHLAASLAQAALKGGKPVFDLPEGRKQLLPVVIPLRYYNEYKRLCDDAPLEKLKNQRTGKMAGFIPWYLMRRNPAGELSEDFFDRLLLGGGCLLILDGLDEVTNRDERGQVKAQVEAIADDIYPGNMILVTARESGYRENAVFGDDFTRLDVQPLDDPQIAALVENWCVQLYPEAVEDQTKDILNAVQNINQRYEAQNLPRLISTPLMTTMVVSVKWGENELPRERAKLYEAAVKVILQAQYLENDEAQKELVNWGGDWEEQRQWLSFLALEMHRSGRDGAAIPEERVREILGNYPGLNGEKLEAFIQAVRLRGGLFEERAELFQFVHLTFQEFLTARLLVQQRKEGLETLRPYVGEAWWREVCLLFYGAAREDYSLFAAEYLNWLEKLEPDEKSLEGHELAAAAILEIEKPDPALRQSQAVKLCKAFESASLETRPATRARAGNTLAALGDPRFDPEHWYLPREENFGFVRIPAGKFIMGSDEGQDREKPQHELDLPYDYWMAKYLVTVAQYRAFVAASKHKTADEDSLHGVANHPVVRVTWQDAMAYCDWLSGQLVVYSKEIAHPDDSFWKGIAAGKFRVCLPSEAEWEKAARGNDGRTYPWGEKPDPNLANYSETGLGTTSAVGAFPGGQSPYGLLDMSGNVWEWTRTIWDEKKYKYRYRLDDDREDLHQRNAQRVLRGGAFYDLVDLLRCACRVGFIPDLRSSHFGFRVMVSPSSK
jgi:formylglycine-generating enzyme required for sulfatase activity/energy-coupling factor transporter ATP-binding protein EcfA2